MDTDGEREHGEPEHSEENLPSAKECELLCSRFAEITQANSAEAQMYLQQHDWDLEKSLQTYYADNDPSDSNKPSDEPAAKSCKVDVISAAASKDASSIKVLSAAASEDASSIKVLSWNLDGLDNVSLLSRTKTAMKVIKQEDPDVVFLQEIVAQSWRLIQEEMSAIYRIVPADSSVQYFTVVLLKKTTVFFDSHKVKPFFTSIMMRQLQILEVNIKGIDVKLMNTHLESTAQHSVERVRQLKQCLEEMTSTDQKYNVIFGGDLNLGGKDFATIAFPSNIDDVWELLGSKTETRYTWDTRYNDNKQMSGAGRPRCRFDRLYFRSSKLKDISVSSFSLTGIERVKDCSRFPSDHWGILCQFHIPAEESK